MEEKIRKERRRELRVRAAALLVMFSLFGFLIYKIFLGYEAGMNEQFTHWEREALAVCGEAQRSQIAGTVENMKEQLLSDTAKTGISLVALTLLAGGVLYFLMREGGKQRRLEEERYAALANFSDTVLFEYDRRSDTLEFTRNAIRLLGIDGNRIEKFSARREQLVHPDDVEYLTNRLEELYRERRTGALEARLLGQDGRWLWCECRVQPLREKNGVVLGKVSDISERKTKEMTLLSLNATDCLTGLMNREALRDHVEVLIDQKKKGFFFMIDVDNFKQINDTQGHEAGDRFLADIGQVLRRSFRDYDPVARIGGDEFAAFMSDTADWDNAEKKAELILAKMACILGSQDAEEAHAETEISVSIGISACPEDGTAWRELYRSADEAMYLAKRRGKNGYFATRKNTSKNFSCKNFNCKEKTLDTKELLLYDKSGD